MTVEKKNWTYNIEQEDNIKLLTKELKIKNTTAQILLNRGINKVSKARSFLKADLNDLYDPFLLKDMDLAVERIKYAVDNMQSIWIYGDYDVDGVSSVSIMLRYFESIDYPVNYYIPDRMEEGYGINKNAIKKIAKEGGNLIITVDCGITSVEEVDYVNDLGLDIIITDHHHCQSQLPAAYAIINPKQTDCKYPFDMICGCGVALKLIQALTPKETFKSSIYNYIDIVAIATVADIVPLLDENRIFVKNGLEYIAKTNNMGINALLDVCDLKQKNLNAGHIGFVIAPRINAAGRLGSAGIGVKLLTTKDSEVAKELSISLNRENQNRQELEIDIFKEAIEMIENNPQYKREKVLVLYKENWHHGVIGIVASRIVERYYKPTIVLSIEKDIAKGSARSISKFNLFETMSLCKDLFEKFGGHEQAAGLSLKTDNIEVFREKINAIADTILTEEDLVPEILCDGKLSLQSIDDDLIEELENLQPYGLGNMSPKFIGLSISSKDIKAVGNEGKHLKINLQADEKVFDAIGFNLGSYADYIKTNDEVGVVFSPEFNEYKGRRKIQLNLKDLKIMTYQNTLRTSFINDYYKTLKVEENQGKAQDFNIEKYKQIKKITVDNKEEYIINTLKNKAKSIILVNNIYNAYALSKTLEIQEKNNNIKYRISFGEAPKFLSDDEMHMVVNPNIEKIKFKIYNNIILYDMLFTKKDYKSFLDANNDVNTFVFHCEKDAVLNEEIIKTLIPDRELLVIIYKALKRSYHRNSINIEKLISELNYDLKMNINEKILKNIIAIFREGNLIEYSLRGNDYYFEILQTKEKVDLKETNTYKQCIKLYNEFIDLKHQLLSYYKEENNNGFS